MPASLNIIEAIKSRTMRRAGNLACIREMKTTFVFQEKPWGKSLRDLDTGLGERIVLRLKWIIEKYGIEMWTGFNWIMAASNDRPL
jgi:hypothetical protein